MAAPRSQNIFVTGGQQQPQPKPWETPGLPPSTGPYSTGPGQHMPDYRRYHGFDRPEMGGVPGIIDPLYGQSPGQGNNGGSAIERYYERLMGLMPTQRQQGLGDLGSILGSFAGDQRANRVVEGNFRGEFDRMMLEREAAQNRVGLESQSDFDRNSLLSRADKRDANSTAMQWSQLAAHLQRGDRVTDPRSGTASYTPASYQERAAATGLAQQAHDNLTDPGFQPTKYKGNWDYQPMDPSKYSKPGIMERIGQYGGLAAGGLSAADQLAGGKIGSWLGSIGKGAALGTKLGTIVPGIGNIAGAGIGAAGGILSKLFGRR